MDRLVDGTVRRQGGNRCCGRRLETTSSACAAVSTICKKDTYKNIPLACKGNPPTRAFSQCEEQLWLCVGAGSKQAAVREGYRRERRTNM